MLTIRSLSEDEALGLRIVTSEFPDMIDREVRWLHTTELPDPSPYIKPNELVLTNGLWLSQTPVDSFVDAVSQADAAGLVFGLTAQNPSIPTGLVESCRTHHLPLIELRIDVAFADLTNAAARIQGAVLEAELTAIVHRGDALATALSRGGGAEGILSVLRRDTDLPLLVVDRSGRRLASLGPALTDDQIHTAATALMRSPPPVEVDLGGSAAALYLVQGAMGEVNAGLFCLKPVGRIADADHEALTQAARFLSLEVAKQQAVHAIEARFAGELLEMILSGPSRIDEVSSRLRAYGVPIDQPLTVFAVAAADNTPIEATPDRIAIALSTMLSVRGIPAFTCARSRDVVAIAPQDKLAQAPRDLARAVSEDMSRQLPGCRIVIGVGDIARDIRGLRESLVRAREVCEVLRHATQPDVAAFSDVATHRMLLGLLDPQVLQRFREQVLGPVRAHDARAHTDLEHTLRVFLANDERWAPTAAALHVHVNTLRNRLARIAELTGRDITRLADRIDLFIALEFDPADS